MIKSPVDQFRERGCLTVKRVLPPELIDRLAEEYFQPFADLENAPPEDKFKVGQRRMQVAPRLKRPFLSPELYANPFALSLIKTLLGEDFLIDSLSVVNARFRCSISRPRPARPNSISAATEGRETKPNSTRPMSRKAIFS